MARHEDLRGQVAIVTGASSGVGWQSALRLAEAGVKLCVTARRQSALEQLRVEVLQRGGECLVSDGDVTVAEDVERVVRECVAHYGRVDLLVNAAAVQSYGDFDQLPWEHITRVFDVNCFGYFRFARAVLPHFKKQGHGHLLNIQSMLAAGSAPLLSAYAASKHATLGWAQSLELELHGTGIQVSNVLVPSVSTPMFDHAPTMLGKKPVPVPPTYDVDLVARAVVRLAKRPGRTSVPAFLQGRLMLWLNGLAPSVGKAVLSRFGARMQTTDVPLDRPEGNLFTPVEQGVGPRGSVPPTPAWKRFSATLGLAALTGGVVGGAVLGTRGLLRAVR
ncbi:SDR family NAD(P)-dependent oxidoreductase [Corallococcus sp. AB049A]|uniref:SDR family NAD(P)-dependent oxidoreductase n=1 Tax=Corallococcus interemptor TaxID=2316720 RepID=A0A3A8Q943_9BACT|nr:MULTISPECIES: SDR family NAD(P)-dependent oxidoreductase [Corallococcus]RKH42006.1 SDR family NAD(P)-dependent oxidoreductase [Corallococcus sp. AB050B]RKH59784.1 SDR family NAD(P)-dependent oxidoreductase [Corallococcus interemptor]RKI53615.1 SDR family NAD(P)-dependent oxidoreductase [Corallococcus sp. AB049A]